MYRVILKCAAAAAAMFCLSNPAKSVEVYMFKGAGDFSFVNENMHFSRGLNKMADILNAEGIHSEVRRFGATEDALKTIRRRKPESIALIGHSMGALASMSLARKLKKEGVRIAYMGLIDIPGPVGVAGENVEWVENYFSINPVYGRLTNANTHPKAKNIHVFGYIHNRMDDSPKVQNGMLAAVRQVHDAEQRLIEPVDQPEVRMASAPTRVDTNQVASVNAQPQPVTRAAASPAPTQVETAAIGQAGSPRAILFTDILQDSQQQPVQEQAQAPLNTGQPITAYTPPKPEVYGYRSAPVPPENVDPISTASIRRAQTSRANSNRDYSRYGAYNGIDSGQRSKRSRESR